MAKKRRAVMCSGQEHKSCRLGSQDPCVALPRPVLPVSVSTSVPIPVSSADGPPAVLGPTRFSPFSLFPQKTNVEQKKEDQCQSQRPSLLSLGDGEERGSKMQEGGARGRWERAVAVPCLGFRAVLFFSSASFCALGFS